VADNYVSIRIRSDDSAKPDLTELRERLKALAGQVATARAEVDDAAADAKLADLQAKLAAADKAVSRPKIDMAGAQRALAQVTAVDAALRRMDDDAAAAAEARDAAAAKSAQDAAAAEIAAYQTAADERAAAAQAAAEAEAAAAREAADRAVEEAQRAADAQVQAAKRAELGVDDLQAKIGALNEDTGVALADVDDQEAKVKLLALQDRIRELNETVARPDIDASGILRASAELAALRAELDAFGDSGAKPAGESAARKFASGFLSYVKPPLSKGALITGGVLSGLAALPALTAGVGALAGTALAAKFLIGSSTAKGPLYNQFERMLGGLESVMKSAVQPMLTPLRSAFQQIGSFARQIEPQLKAVFGAIGPLVQPLVYGLEGLVGGILPGFISLMQAAKPAVQAVAGLLGGLGADLGQMFSSFAPTVKASAQVLRMLGGLLNGLLPVIGKLAGSLAGSLAPVLATFGKAIVALTPAITIVGKVLGSLAGAILTSLSGALQAIATLIGGLAKPLTVLAAALSQVFTLMENTGTFGVLEDALENLAPLIAQLITAFVSGLAPAIPPIIGAITQLSTGAVQVLVRMITDLLGALIPIAPLLGRLAPYVLAIIGAMKLWAAIQAILNVLLDANPIGLLVIAIGLLIVAVVEIVKHWADFKRWGEDAFHAVARAIGTVIDWVKSHWPLLLAVITGPIGLAIGWIVQHWGTVTHAFDAVISWVKSNWKTILLWLVDPIGMAYHEIMSHAHQIAQSFDQMRHDVASILDDACHDVASAFTDVIRSITSFAGWLPRAIGDAWDRAIRFLASALETIRHLIAAAFDWWLNANETMLRAVVSFFEGLPGKIGRTLASLPGQLMEAGKNAILGLIHGITSAASAIPGVMKSLASDVESYFTDPLKIFSPSRVMADHGENVPGGVALGILRGVSKVKSAMSQVVSTVTGAGVGAGGMALAGAGGGQFEMTLKVAKTGDKVLDAVMEGIRLEVRHKGGGGPNSVQKTFGQRW